MKVNSKFLALCLMVLSSITLMKAQSNNPDKRAERQLEKLTTDLALSETQVSQLTEILTAHTAKVKAAKDAETERGAARETIKSLRDEKDAAIKGILNTEQATKYATIKEDRKGKGKRGKKGRKGKKGEKGKRGHGHKSAATPEERAQHHTDRLAEKLALTETQTSEVAKINLDFAKKIKATKDAETERGANKEAVKTLKTEQKTAIKAVLNSDQLTAFEAMKDERKEKRGRGHRSAATPEERAQHHTDRLVEKLALTETQTTEVANINLDFAKKIKATKDAETERGANREAVKNLKTEQKAAIKEVLTPEQATAFEAMKGERKGHRGKGKREKRCKDCK